MRRNNLERQRLRDAMEIVYPPELPVSQRKDEITAAIREHQVVVLCGETGSGKTTQLPKICLEAGRGVTRMVGHTQPRRIAARTVATRIAQELMVNLRREVGYKVRFGDQTSSETLIKIMTDGILLAETQSDRLLEQYDTLIIDEAHERSLNIDFLLGYLKQLLPRRRDLKLIITSATIDPKRFSKHFNNAPVIEVSGRTYPVEVHYRPVEPDKHADEADPIQAIPAAIDELWSQQRGDTLVFLPGEREIRETAEALRRIYPSDVDILPLYARLSTDQQLRVFQSGARRRIILATNVAETSLTVPNIRYVVDPGLARISRYSPRSKVQRLPIEPISQASADQRKGRCGRVASGVCVRLYSEEDFTKRPRFTDPEILRTSLASVILQMKYLRLGGIEHFPFIDPPEQRQIRDGYQTLHELHAIDEQNNLTDLGRMLARLPVDPRIGRMVLEASEENCLNEILIIASALSVQDPRLRPIEAPEAADASHNRYRDPQSDFLSFIRLWRFFRTQERELSNNQFRRFCRDNFLSWTRLREWHEVHKQLLALVAEMKLASRHQPEPEQPHDADELFSAEKHAAIHRSLLSGLLSNLGQKGEKFEYTGARAHKFHLFPGSALFKNKPQWVVAAEIVETTKTYARTVASIQPQWIERLAEHLVKRSYHDPHWQPKTAHVVAYERVTLYGLVIVPKRLVHYGPIEPKVAREIFIQHALVEMDMKSAAPFMKHNRSLEVEVELLEAKARRRGLLADPSVRYAHFDGVIPTDVFNGPLLDKWRREAERRNPQILFLARHHYLKAEVPEITAQRFPDAIDAGGIKLALEYRFDPSSAADGVSVVIPLALLNQVSAERFDWLVPGMLREKIEELIRSLPKSLRTQFIPAAEYATAAANSFALASEGHLTESLAFFLRRNSTAILGSSDFDPRSLSEYLKMNFRIVDEAGEFVLQGRDLEAIRRELRVEVTKAFARLPRSQYHRDDIASWDFGDLPDKVDVKRHGMTIAGYPALVEEGGRVALRVLDSPEFAAVSMRAGVRRLFMNQIKPEVVRIVRTMRGIDSMSLHYKTVGRSDDLKRDLSAAIVDCALAIKPTLSLDVRTRDQFLQLAEQGWKRLPQAANEIQPIVAQILEEYQSVARELSRNFPGSLQPSVHDMRQQVARLLFPGFIASTPLDWLPHLARFLQAVGVRLKKLLNAGLSRDATNMATVLPLQQQWQTRRAKHREVGLVDPNLDLYGWMLEELRVSLFAQELKTSIPISPQRLEKQWSLVR